MYLTYEFYLDIAFVVEKLNCHKSEPHAGYLCIVKQILWYLKKTITLDIEWGKSHAGHQSGGKIESWIWLHMQIAAALVTPRIGSQLRDITFF